MLTNDEKVCKVMETLNIEAEVLMNNFLVLNDVVKSILSLQVHRINGEEYMKAADIAAICESGFKSLSTHAKKE